MSWFLKKTIGVGFLLFFIWPFSGFSRATVLSKAPLNMMSLETLSKTLGDVPKGSLRPYKARYRLKPAHKGWQNLDLTDFEGSMEAVMHYHSDNWLYHETGSYLYTGTKGRLEERSWQYQMRESAKGDRFFFHYVLKNGRRIIEESKGHVALNPNFEEAVIHFEKPFPKSVKYGRKLMFPLSLRRYILAAKGTQAKTMSFNLFQGKPLCTLAETTCFIGVPQTVIWQAHQKVARKMIVWPVMEAFYPEAKEGDLIMPQEKASYLMTNMGMPLKKTAFVGTQEINFFLEKAFVG